MKITRIETLNCDAGWRPWTYVKVQTDEGLVGYGEYGGGRNAHAIAACIRDVEAVLLGKDPRHIERLIWEMRWVMRNNPSGIAHKTIAGIDKNCRLIKGQVFLWNGAKDWSDLWDVDGTIAK